MCVCARALSRVQFFATPWTVARQAPLSMEFSRQGCWERVALPSPGTLPYPGIEAGPLASPALAGGRVTASATGDCAASYTDAQPLVQRARHARQTTRHVHAGPRLGKFCAGDFLYILSAETSNQRGRHSWAESFSPSHPTLHRKF